MKMFGEIMLNHGSVQHMTQELITNRKRCVQNVKEISPMEIITQAGTTPTSTSIKRNH